MSSSLKRPSSTDLEQTDWQDGEAAEGAEFQEADAHAPSGLEGTGLEDDDEDFETTGLEDTGLAEQDDEDDLFGDRDPVEGAPAEDAAPVEQPPAPEALQDEMDELHDEQHVPEAEEDVPMEKKKKGGEDLQQMLAIVKLFISKLEFAAEEDMKAFEQGKPAAKKLKMVKELEDMIAMKKRHETLLNGGLLGAIKSWLEPLRDPKTGRMILPHARVRAAVYRALERLPLDTHHQESRDRLKVSGIGPMLVFYSKCSAESPANQRAANDLVQKWIMPIVEEGRTDIRNQDLAAQRKLEAKKSLKLRRHLEKESEANEAERLRRAAENKTVGDPGYRYHARVPKQARLDYVEMPQVPQSVSQRLAEKQEREGGTRALIKKQVLKIDRINRTSGKQRSSSVQVSGRVLQ